jgi:microcin C transport system substrate-binding protein
MNRRRLGALVFIAAVSAGGLPAVSKDAVRVSHGVSVFDDLKYRAGFRHFAYVNPSAPKGGALKVRGIAGFDNFNSYILKGVVPDYLGLTFDSLMTPAADEPDSYYGLVAKSAEMPADRSWMYRFRRRSSICSGGCRIATSWHTFSSATI